MDMLLVEPIDLELVADLCAQSQKRPPSPARDRSRWHVSNLLTSAHLIAKGDIRYHEFEGHPSGIMSFGRIWEFAVDCYLTYYAAKRGGFFTSDMESVAGGIIGSLDGVMWLPDLGWLVCETKLRFTLNGDIPLGHLQQIRAYCYLAGTDLVCYVSGHVSSTPPTAQATMRIIRLTKQSIEECWQGILNTKKYLESRDCCPQKES